MKNFVLSILAPPGGGKGTQGKLLRDKLRANYLATGDLIRQMASDSTPLGIKVKQKYDLGIPQPDDTIISIFEKKLIDILQTIGNDKRFIFDSFPLSVNQADKLFNLAKKLKFSQPWLVYLNVSPESVIKRVALRRFCLKCGTSYLLSSKSYLLNKCGKCAGELVMRNDDKPEIIKNRITEYKKRILDLKNYYKLQEKLIEIDGELSINKVHSTIITQLINRKII